MYMFLCAIGNKVTFYHGFIIHPQHLFAVFLQNPNPSIFGVPQKCAKFFYFAYGTLYNFDM